MNKPTFQSIKQHSPTKPVLVFVSSRRQTRLTALDLIGMLATEENPRQFVRMADQQMEQLTAGVRDPNLKLTLTFGVGIHHAGLTDKDRRLVEELFVNQKIQVLIATATLAWGVNFPAHLVVVKGTEYYDGKTRRYVDMPITDVLQMMGRAGRPQYDDQGVACVFVHDTKKDFYKKFLYEPFPVESSLLDVLPDHLNAEIVAGTVASKQEAVDYLTWTYFFRRLLQNPAYYKLERIEPAAVNQFLSSLIRRCLSQLEAASCIEFDDDGGQVRPTSLGKIASYYYLSHATLQLFRDRLSATSSLPELLAVLSHSREYDEIPVRHNEDAMNGELAKMCRLAVNPHALDSSNTKAHLLFQAHFSRLPLPCADYATDTKSVLDQAIRILQAMIDVAAECAWLATTLRLQQLMQMVIQAVWIDDPPAAVLPHLGAALLPLLANSDPANDRTQLPVLQRALADAHQQHKVRALLAANLDPDQIQDVCNVVASLPVIDVTISVSCGGRSDSKVVVVDPATTVRNAQWIPVPMGHECLLDVKFVVRRNLTTAAAAGPPAPNSAASGGARPKQSKQAAASSSSSIGVRSSHATKSSAYAPRFPKAKDEGWFLTLGICETNELVAMKRVAVDGRRSQSSHQLGFVAPDRPGRSVLTLYVASDCYVGLDQQYSVYLQAEPASADDDGNDGEESFPDYE